MNMDGRPPFAAAIFKRGCEAVPEGLWPMMSAAFEFFSLTL